MKNVNLEVMKLDPKRWALLQIPIGVFLYIVVMISALFTGEFEPGAFAAIFIGFPLVIIPSLLIVGWLQALLINLCIRAMGKGPVLEIRTPHKTPSGEYTIDIWERK